jgi:hypothetical protein
VFWVEKVNLEKHGFRMRADSNPLRDPYTGCSARW